MEVKQKPRLHFGRLSEVVAVRREMYADIPADTPIETILESDYWMHYARDLRPMDIIEAFCEDGSWEANLRVMFVSTTDVKVEVRWKKNYEVADFVGETDSHEIKWKGPVRKFAVIHKETGNVVKDNFTKEQAHEFLRDYIKQIGA